ncbi:hypothetical protein KAR91_74375 [Candidatus Pacearchaeota archaeon]|nr:hypothetical protein [Candidatus Pacearchaeota archaeon]
MRDDNKTKVAEQIVFGVSVLIFSSFIILSVIFESFRTFETDLIILLTGVLSVVGAYRYIYDFWYGVLLFIDKGGDE